MTLTSRFTAFITALALLLAPVGAVAQEGEYSPELVEEVNAHFKQGAQHYYDEEYEEAIDEFEQAHAKIPNAIFLYNISLAHNRLGEKEEALQRAEEAEAMGGLSETDQAQNRARMAALYGTKSAEQTAVQVSMRSDHGAPVFDFSVWGWVGSGLVVAGVLAYGGVLAIDRGLRNDVEAYKAAAARDDVDEYNRLRDEIKPRQGTGRALFALATLAVIGGAALVVYDVKFNDEKSSARLLLSPTTKGAAVMFSGRF